LPSPSTIAPGKGRSSGVLTEEYECAFLEVGIKNVSGEAWGAAGTGLLEELGDEMR
jgi:hypothetical protein